MDDASLESRLDSLTSSAGNRALEVDLEVRMLLELLTDYSNRTRSELDRRSRQAMMISFLISLFGIFSGVAAYFLPSFISDLQLVAEGTASTSEVILLLASATTFTGALVLVFQFFGSNENLKFEIRRLSSVLKSLARRSSQLIDTQRLQYSDGILLEIALSDAENLVERSTVNLSPSSPFHIIAKILN